MNSLPFIGIFYICLFFLPIYLFSEEKYLSQESCSKTQICSRLFRNEDGIFIRFTHNGNFLVPASIRVVFTKSQNLGTPESGIERFVIKADETIDLGPYVIRDSGKKWSINYQFFKIWGDVSLPADRNFIYRLPFEGKARLSQGYFGEYSHEDRHALDFSMPEGTSVLAARDGVVIKTEDQYETGGADRSFMDKSNFIMILHEDGTYAFYGHLVHQGVLVEPGDYVYQGQRIGLSGNTGFSSNPHLHFEVTKPGWNFGKGEDPSIPTFFSNESSRGEYLSANRIYWHEDIPLEKLPILLNENMSLCRNVSKQGVGSSCGKIFPPGEKLFLIVEVIQPGEHNFYLEVRDEKDRILGNSWTIKTQKNWIYFYTGIRSGLNPGTYRIFIRREIPEGWEEYPPVEFAVNPKD